MHKIEFGYEADRTIRFQRTVVRGESVPGSKMPPGEKHALR